jgi:NTE family protein
MACSALADRLRSATGRAFVAILCVLAGGCAQWPATPRLEQAGASGYRPAEASRPGQSDDLLVVLAISGGGTRAAALGYGVLEELRRTEVTVNGVKRRLLDEVDMISAVSGGTLPATYFGLRGEKTFEEFEGRVLYHNLERDLVMRILSPVNWFRLPSSTFGRSDLFAEIYDETVFDGATFADLKRPGGPFVIINGTDITTGARFSYTQDQFDAICGDLSRVTLGRAVATSTALPPLLTPITLENRGGTCGRKPPAWLAAAEAAAASKTGTPGRALLRARALQAYEDPGRPYIHLFDGGLSENLGLSEVLRAFEILKVEPDETVLPALRRARTVVVIAANAVRFPDVDWDRSPAPPGKDTLTDQMWSIPVDRISFDAVEQVREKLEAWQADAPADSPQRRSYFAQITFDSLKDPAERAYFRQVKTRLALPKEQVDRLREVGGRLLREAPGFQRLLADLNSGR